MFKFLEDFVVSKCVQHIGEYILKNVYEWHISPKPRSRPRMLGMRRLIARPFYKQSVNEKLGFGCCLSSKWLPKDIDKK